MKSLTRFPVLTMVLALGLAVARPAMAVDSYRYMHVSIETPWLIFLFLLAAVFVPFVLMAVLMWRFAPRRKKPDSSKGDADHG